MSELEKLIEQKRQLERKIKEMKNASLIHCGLSKFEIEPGSNKYRLSIEGMQTRRKYETKEQVSKRCGKSAYYYSNRNELGTYEARFWQTIIRTENKQTVIEYIDRIIEDFGKLKKTIEKNTDGSIIEQLYETFGNNKPKEVTSK